MCIRDSYFGLSLDALWAQYEHVAPLALQLRHNGSAMPTLMAWRQALQQCKAARTFRVAGGEESPLKELEAVLLRYAA
eukprot:1901758-Prorocentrum_lima.AAC.1